MKLTIILFLLALLAQGQESKWERKIEKDGNTILFKLTNAADEEVEAIALYNLIVDKLAEKFKAQPLSCSREVSFEGTVKPAIIKLRVIIPKDPRSYIETTFGFLKGQALEEQLKDPIEKLMSHLACPNP